MDTNDVWTEKYRPKNLRMLLSEEKVKWVKL
jgi:hypothetical protein